MTRTLAGVCLLLLASACSSMLPHSEQGTQSRWKTYEEAQEAFDQIVPGVTTAADLKKLNLDPAVNPNIAILNYADVMRYFIVSPSLSINDLDTGVRECVAAKTQCRGYQVDQKLVNKKRDGNVVLDLFGFVRHTQTNGWRFRGLVLLRGGVVTYKLTGGQPAIAEQENTQNPLGPVQSFAGHVFGWSPGTN